MHIHAPAAVAYRVVKAAMLQDIVFVQQVIALQTAAFAHARQRAHPIQGVVFGVMLMQPFVVVFDMIPDAVGVGHQVVADLLIIGDDIVAVAHQLAPPIAVVDGGAAGHGRALVFLGIRGVAHVDMIAHFHAVDALGQLLFGQVLSEGWGGEGHGMAHIDGAHQDGIAHTLVIGLFGGVGLVELAVRLTPGTESRARVVAQGAVARGIHKQRRGQAKAHFGGFLHAVDGRDAAAFGFAIVHHGIMVQRQALLLLGGLKEDHIPDGIAEIVVAGLVFQHQLVQDAALGVIGLLQALIRARNVDADFAGGVAAQHGTGVDQGGVYALARAGQRGAHACHAAAHDDDVIMRFLKALGSSFHGGSSFLIDSLRGDEGTRDTILSWSPRKNQRRLRVTQKSS